MAEMTTNTFAIQISIPGQSDRVVDGVAQVALNADFGAIVLVGSNNETLAVVVPAPGMVISAAG
jgi:hypothetical protein